MDFRKLEIFRAVAEKQSFAKASACLYISQSAVSIAIRKLEDELELQLFVRSNKSVKLTPEGEVLLRHACRIMSQAADARLELSEMQELKRGQVRVGIPAMLASYYFPRYLVAFKQQYPGISVVIIDEGTRLIREHIEQGLIDMGIINMEDVSNGIEAHMLIHEEMLLCTSSSHPLAHKRAIRIAQLRDQRLILYRDGYFLKEIVSRLFADSHVAPEIDFETNLVQLMKTLVLSGLGVSVCLRSVLREESGLSGIPFSPRLKLKFGLAWKKNNYLSRANRTFAEFMLAAGET